jgi:putative MATE family efflux protein
LIRSDLKGVLRLAVPAALKHLLDILQILIDMIMVGMLSIYALAAVGMSMQFMMVINVLMTLYVVGGNAVIARLIGERRRHRAGALMFTLILFSLVLSVPVSLTGYIFASDFYIWMGAGMEVAKEGGIYFSIITLGIAVIFLDTLFFNALSAAGDTTSSLYIKAVSAVINLVLNYMLIFGHGGFEAMGIAGAAYATLIAYVFNVAAYTYIFSRRKKKLGVIPKITMYDLKRVVRVGGNAALERLITVTSFIIFVAVITSYGTAALAGYQVGLRIEGIAFMPGFGFAIAATALVGQNLGARNPDAAYRAGMLSTKVAAWFMGSVGLVMVIIPEPFVALFTNDPETIDQASLYLRLVGISQVPLAMTFVLSGALRGAGATKTTLKINVTALWLLRVIPSYIAMKLGFGILAIYIIMMVETFVKGGLFWHVFRKREWEKIKV